MVSTQRIMVAALELSRTAIAEICALLKGSRGHYGR